MDLRPIIFAVIFLVIAAVFAAKALSRYRLRRRIQNTPLSRIGHITTGHFAVNGRVVTTQQCLKAPDTGRPCVYYRFWRRRKYFAHTRTYVDCKSIPWSVNDDTGLAEVVTQITEYSYKLENSGSDFAGEGRSEESEGFDPLKDAMLLLDVRASRGFRGEPQWKCRETIIGKGAWLYLIGRVNVGDEDIRFDNSDGDLIIANSRDALLRYLGLTTLGWSTAAFISLVAGMTCALYGLR